MQLQDELEKGHKLHLAGVSCSKEYFHDTSFTPSASPSNNQRLHYQSSSESCASSLDTLNQGRSLQRSAIHGCHALGSAMRKLGSSPVMTHTAYTAASKPKTPPPRRHMKDWKTPLLKKRSKVDAGVISSHRTGASIHRMNQKEILSRGANELCSISIPAEEDTSQNSIMTGATSSELSITEETQHRDQLEEQHKTPTTSSDTSTATPAIRSQSFGEYLGTPFRSATKTQKQTTISDSEAERAGLFQQLYLTVSRLQANGAASADILSLTHSALALKTKKLSVGTDSAISASLSDYFALITNNAKKSELLEQGTNKGSHEPNAKADIHLPPTLSITDGVPRSRRSELPSLSSSSSSSFSNSNNQREMGNRRIEHAENTPSRFLTPNVQIKEGNYTSASVSEISKTPPSTDSTSIKKSVAWEHLDLHASDNSENLKPSNTQSKPSEQSKASIFKTTPKIGSTLSSSGSHLSGISTITPRVGPHTPALRTSRRISDTRYLDTVSGISSNKPDLGVSAAISSLLHYPSIPASAVQHRSELPSGSNASGEKQCTCTKGVLGTSSHVQCDVHKSSFYSALHSSARPLPMQGVLDDTQGFAGFEVFTTPMDVATIASRHIAPCDKLEASPVSISGIPSRHPNEASLQLSNTGCHPQMSFTPTVITRDYTIGIGSLGMYFNQRALPEDVGVPRASFPQFSYQRKIALQPQVNETKELPSDPATRLNCQSIASCHSSSFGVVDFTLESGNISELKHNHTDSTQYTQLYHQSISSQSGKLISQDEQANGGNHCSSSTFPLVSLAVKNSGQNSLGEGTSGGKLYTHNLASPGIKLIARKRIAQRMQQFDSYDQEPKKVMLSDSPDKSDGEVEREYDNGSDSEPQDRPNRIRRSSRTVQTASMSQSSTASQDQFSANNSKCSPDNIRVLPTVKSQAEKVEDLSQEAEEAVTSLGIIISDSDPVVEYLMDLKLTILDGLLQLVKPLSQLPRRFHVVDHQVVAWWPVDVPKKHVSKLSKRDKISVIVAILRFVADGLSPEEFLDRMTQRIISNLDAAESLRSYVEAMISVLFQSKAFIDPENSIITPNSLFVFKEPHAKGRARAAGLSHALENESDSEEEEVRPQSALRRRLRLSSSSTSCNEEDTSFDEGADTQDDSMPLSTCRRTRSATLRTLRNGRSQRSFRW